MSTMLLSIKPEYAKAILQGKKQFEFRKTRCKQGINRIIFYASSPQKEVVGEAEIDEILEDTPARIWEQAKSAPGVSKKFFNTYYSGKNKAIAYRLKNVVVYDKPHSLSDYGIKHAPQSFVYVD